jgi:hypothetical protein
MDKLPLKKDLTFDLVLLLIVESPCLSYASQNLCSCVGSILFIELYSPKESWSLLFLKPSSFDLIYY